MTLKVVTQRPNGVEPAVLPDDPVQAPDVWYQDLTRFGQASSTAKLILATLEAAKTTVGVWFYKNVLTKDAQGFVTGSANDIITKGEKGEEIDRISSTTDSNFYSPAGMGDFRRGLEEYDGGIVVVNVANPVETYRKTGKKVAEEAWVTSDNNDELKMGLVLSFYHELGHAKQWLDLTASEYDKYTKTKLQDLENNNVRDHEYKVGIELGIPREMLRAKYG